MTALSIVFLIKIFFTIIFWCIPLLLFPATLFVSLGVPSPQPIIFIRLLGVAYVALVVAYIFGFNDLNQGKDIQDTIWVGIVSNGLASITLFFSGAIGMWSQWKFCANLYMWISAVVTALITLGLIVTGLILID